MRGTLILQGAPHHKRKDDNVNQITDPPNTYGFGLDFNYALWVQGTNITLVNVPWNNDYRDIVEFKNKSALNTYIDSIENAGTTIRNLSYVKPNQPIRIDIPFNAAYQYNYLRASNPLQPIPGSETKDFYYFIVDVRYIAPNTTEIVVQLDVWQTFGFDAEFGNCYIERGHVGIANENNFDSYGRDYLTVPEGLNAGSEYQVVERRSDAVATRNGIADAGNILVVTTVDVFGDYGDTSDPKLQAPEAESFHNMPMGVGMYVFKTSSDFYNFMNMIRQYPWIAQGVVSVTFIPDLSRYYKNLVWVDHTDGGIFKYIKLTNLFNYNGGGDAENNFGLDPVNKTTTMYANWRTAVINKLPVKYRHLKKFMTFPYMMIEITTWSGNPIVLKPESWADDNATLLERINIIPPGQRVSFIPRSYNSLSSATVSANGDDGGEFLDLATHITNFPSFPIVNNASGLYLAANAASIAFSFESANWSQQRALRSNEITYDQASGEMSTMQKNMMVGRVADHAQTVIGNDASKQSMVVNTISGVVSGAAGGAALGPQGAAAGAAMRMVNGIGSAANTGIQINAANQALGVRNTAAIDSTRNTVHQSGFVRDTNKDLSDWAAKGDYGNAIAGINAKIEDARLIQPSKLGQFGGEIMNALYNNYEVSVRWKMVDSASIKIIGDYWLRYGYAVNRFTTIQTLKVMSKFSYWKMQETYLVGTRMPETFKQTIRGIFEKGVTVWNAPEYIGNTDIADNVPVGGITL